MMPKESEPVLSLEGHRRKILTMEYNPVAPGVFATGSRYGVDCPYELVMVPAKCGVSFRNAS